MGTIYGSKIVTDGLIFYVDAANTKSYPGSGTDWYDLSGGGRIVALNEEPTINAYDLQFQEQRGYISNLLDENITTDLTIECWYMPIDMKASCCATVFGVYNFRLFQIGNTLQTMMGADNGEGTRIWTHPSFGISDNNWHHVVFARRNSDRFVVWIDGNQSKNDTTYSGLELWENKDDWYISYSTHLDVKISICRVYDYGLSDSDIERNFNALKGRFGI
jgi:hypothetical protein